MEKEEIKQLLISVGNDTEIIRATEKEPIIPFLVNGEMASVKWFKQGKLSFTTA